MRVLRSVVALLLAAGAVTGCGSAGQPLSDPAPGLLAAATAAASGDCPGADVLRTRLGSTGVAYDYQPVGSPRELALEGLMASCDDEGLVGWHGEGPGWTLPDLDAVILGVLGPPDDVGALQGAWEPGGGGGPALEVVGGPEHCDLESTTIAYVGGFDRMFLRDPEGIVSSGLVGTLALAAPAPDGRLTLVWGRADDSSVRFALVDGEDGLAVDLGDGRWERWPEVVPVVGCA